ncbi:hypothetical protein [Imhoffiella purpurea]|uniref:Uncharacterized protein n=1 Tax=Imhoffiella purpurea TaxID=1249627 RepID=W9V3Y8_9GAMM|nr:hypothetical protein [Imhoffiella purpurea]EXJ14049.1 hypothetical protein D779_3011 [Imhoffiella purpurea]
MSDAPFDLVDAKDDFTDTDWYHTCRETQTPYVVVRSGETSADVLWDYVTLPPCCDARLRGDFQALERDVRAIFERFAQPESYLRVKPTLICFDRLTFDHAKSAATELYRLIAGYLPRPYIARPVAIHADSPIAQPAQNAYERSRFWMDEGETAGRA